MPVDAEPTAAMPPPPPGADAAAVPEPTALRESMAVDAVNGAAPAEPGKDGTDTESAMAVNGAGEAGHESSAANSPSPAPPTKEEQEEAERMLEEQKRLLLADLAVAASQYNSQLLRERRQRPYFYDMHTRLKHVPYNRSPVILDRRPASEYTVALLPGHYQEYKPDVLAEVEELHKRGELKPVAVVPSPLQGRPTEGVRVMGSALTPDLVAPTSEAIATAVATILAQGLVPAPIAPGSTIVKPLSGKVRAQRTWGATVGDPVANLGGRSLGDSYKKAQRHMEAGLCGVTMPSGRLCKMPGDHFGRCLKHKDWIVPGVTKGVTLMSERRANTAAPLSPAVAAAHAPQARCEIMMNSGQPCGRAVAKPGDRCILHKIPGRWGAFLCGEPLETMQHCPAHVDRPGGRCPQHTIKSDSAPSNLVAPSGARLRRVCFACEKPETPEDRLLQCITCQRFGHAACWELEPAIFAKALTYAWQCVDDKMCMVCRDPGNEELLMICDGCDRGCHTFCAVPRLDRLPKGTWHCSQCA